MGLDVINIGKCEKINKSIKNLLVRSDFIMKKFFLSIAAFVSVIIIIVAVYNLKTTKIFEGYIMDKHCSEKNPTEKTKMCLNMEVCAASGYGISIKQDDGKYKFYKFDDKGQELAKDIIEKSTKEKAIPIEVNGKLDEDTLRVSKISEK